MKFGDLHENLRRETLRRIERGLTSGAALARATGFKPGHISHFLARKRVLSLDGLDRVLAAQHLSLLDLLPAGAVPTAQSTHHPVSLTRSVPVVSHSAAATQARIRAADVLETVEVPDTVLQSSRERPSHGRSVWHRWVSVRVGGAQAAEISPLLNENDVAVIDRHYNSPAVYRPHQRSIYAAYAAGAFHLCFLEVDGKRLILRPCNAQMPVHIVDLTPKAETPEPIVGRVSYVLSEL